MKCVECGLEMEERNTTWWKCLTPGCKVYSFHESFHALGHNTVKRVVPPEQYKDGTIFKAVPVQLATGFLWAGEKEVAS